MDKEVVGEHSIWIPDNYIQRSRDFPEDKEGGVWMTSTVLPIHVVEHVTITIEVPEKKKA